MLLQLFSEGEIGGTTHTCIGQEAVAVGVGGVVDVRRDTVVSNHRGHGHFIAVTGNLEGLFAEIMGRQGAVSNGVGGSQHLHYKNFLSHGIQGGGVGVATGLALAHKLSKTQGVSFVFMGDGTFGEGIVYESFNMAALWKLPVLYIVEDNQIAQSTPASKNRAGSLVSRFESFGIPAKKIDGQDLFSVRSETEITVEKIRSGKGPVGLIMKTNRLGPHSKGDDTRTDEFLADLWERDPIQLVQRNNLSWGHDLAILERKQDEMIRSIVDKLREAEPITYSPSTQEIVQRAGSSGQFNGRVSERINWALHEQMNKESRTVCIGQDIADEYGGAFKITRGLSSRHPDRVISTPISEGGIVALANGLTLGGLKPIVEIMFGDFLFLAADQIANHACLFADLHDSEDGYSLVVRTPMGGRRGYGPTHSQSVEKHFLGLDGLTTVAVNHTQDPADLFLWATAQTRPILFLENKSLYGLRQYRPPTWCKREDIIENTGTRITLIGNELKHPDVVLVGYGGVAPYVLDSIKELKKESIRVLVIIPEQVSPIGEKLLEILCRIGSPLLIVEESEPKFGWGAEMMAQILERGNQVSIRRVGATQTLVPASPLMEREVLPGVAAVLKETYALLEGSDN